MSRITGEESDSIEIILRALEKLKAHYERDLPEDPVLEHLTRGLPVLRYLVQPHVDGHNECTCEHPKSVHTDHIEYNGKEFREACKACACLHFNRK